MDVTARHPVGRDEEIGSIVQLLPRIWSGLHFRTTMVESEKLGRKSPTT